MTRNNVLSAATAAVVLGCAITLGAQAPEAPQAPAAPPAPQAAPPATPPAAVTPPAVAQAPTPEPPPPPPPPPQAQGADSLDEITDGRQDIVRVGQDFTLAAGEEARDVVVIMGNAAVDGHVRDLVVVMGTVRLGPTAMIDRTLTSVMGGVTAAEGATVGREVVVVGGSLDAPPDFGRNREHVVINPPFFGQRMNAVMPYLTQGLLWGRVIVPGLPWVWGVVGVFFILYLVVNLLADGPVRAAATVIDEKTLTAFGTGLLMLLIVGPVSVLLAVSVVGLLAIPVLHFALLAAAVVGKVGTLRWMGGRVWRSDAPGPAQATGTFVIGFVMVTLLYMVPVLGMAAFALLGVLGLGAATLALVAAYRREQPPAPQAPAPQAPAPFPATPAASSLAAPMESSGFSVSTEGAAVPVSTAPPPVGLAAHDASAFPRAAFRDRLAALVLDVILVGIVVGALPLRGNRGFVLVMLAYHIAFWAWRQTTVGGIICQLRIVRTDGLPLTVGDAFVRGLSAIFSVVVVGLGFFWVLRDPERQSWHDKIAGTYVVKVPRNWRG